MLHIISLYWNVFVLCYTVNAWAIRWKLEWIFFKSLNIFFVIGLESLPIVHIMEVYFIMLNTSVRNFTVGWGLPLLFGTVQ